MPMSATPSPYKRLLVIISVRTKDYIQKDKNNRKYIGSVVGTARQT